MDREQLIECIANAIEQGPGRTLPPYRKMADHVLDAITAAGMVVVPGADLRAMIAEASTVSCVSVSMRQSLPFLSGKVRKFPYL
mgnify:CR=1 FL=1